MCNNITKLMDLMQEIGDFKLALLRSKGFQPLCSMPHVAMLVCIEYILCKITGPLWPFHLKN